jgi:hypothetical protein
MNLLKALGADSLTPDDKAELKTFYMRAVMAALSAGPKVTPMDLMLGVMRDPHVAFSEKKRTRVAQQRSAAMNRACRACNAHCQNQ